MVEESMGAPIQSYISPDMGDFQKNRVGELCKFESRKMAS